MIGKFTILFEDPFWVGIAERQDDAGYSAGRYVFGKEPSEAELIEFALKQWKEILYSRPVAETPTEEKQANFKRRQREARRAVVWVNSTKAQQAISRQREENKEAHREVSKAEEDAHEHHKLLVRREKKREKHKGH